MTPFIEKSKSRRRGLSLKWEIAIALAIKVILLWLLWDFFFSTPKAKHMHLPEQQVSQHLFSGNVANKAGQPSNLTPYSTSNSTFISPIIPASTPK